MVLLILGRAIWDRNASQVGDTGSAFAFLQDSGGSVLLGIVALGLVCYGVFRVVVLARHRRVVVR